jgi:multiple sugar transport system substrate-binding protein
MKKLVAAVLTFLMSAGLVACASTGGTASTSQTPAQEAPSESADSAANDAEPSAEKTVITYWNGFTGADGDVLRELTEKYNATNEKNIEVVLDIMPWDSLYQKLSTTLPVGEGPDIIAFNTERIGTYAKPGALADIGDLYAGGGLDASQIPPALHENLQFNGKYYGVPMNIATLLMYYNKDLFEAAGLDPDSPPATWDELEDYAKKLTKNVNGEQQYGFGMATNNTIPMWPIMIWAGGGDFIRDGKSVFNSAENIQTITRFANLIRNDGIAPAVMTGGEIDKLFESGKLGMYFCGPWATGTFDAAGLNYGIAAPPAGPGGKATLGTGVAMVMTQSSKNKEAVYDFFQFWNGVDAQVEWSLGVGYPLANNAASDDARLSANLNIAAFSSVSNDARFYLQQLTNYDAIDAQIIIPTIEEILLNGSDVKTTLDNAAAQMDELLSQQ